MVMRNFHKFLEEKISQNEGLGKILGKFITNLGQKKEPEEELTPAEKYKRMRSTAVMPEKDPDNEREDRGNIGGGDPFKPKRK